MVTSVRQIAVRYVRPGAAEEARLRSAVAELQARSILRAAGLAGRIAGTPGAEAEDDYEASAAPGREKAPTEGAGAEEVG